MKKLISAILITAMTFSLFGCEEQLPEEPHAETTTTAAVTTEEITATAPPVTTRPTVTEVTEESEIPPRPVPAEKNWNVVEVSEGNEFIDFEYIKDYKGITDREQVKELADKAERFLLENKGFKPKPEYIEHYKDYFDENGNLKPVFHMAIIEDLDGDGKDEKFILMNMPSEDSFYNIRCYLLFINKNNEVELLNDYWFLPDSHKIEEISLLDYGKVKQLIVGSWGFCGVDGHFSLYGIKNSEPILHYEFRGQFIKYKCFLSGIGYQAYGSLMYFDTVENEYRIIVGEELDLDEVMAMDTTNALADIEKFREEYDVYLIGGKYYCFVMRCMDSGMSFVYENGKFVRVDNAVRFSATYEGKKLVKNIDMNKAESEMKKPTAHKPEPEEEPDSSESEYVEVSEGNEFIDFEYIKDYKGITDREQVKELADLAEKAVSESDNYTERIAFIKSHISVEYDKYTSKNGEPKPEFKNAFIEDFDGDEKEEAFIIVDTLFQPFDENAATIESYLVFINNNNEAEIVNYFISIYETALFDYGKTKQLFINSYGNMGVTEHGAIMGLKDGKAVEIYGFRGTIEKHGCFLTSYCWQGIGDLLYFDTVAGEYRAIVGEWLDMKNVLSMDKTDSLHKVRQKYENGEFINVQLIGKKYYSFSDGIKEFTFIYKDGEFIPADDKGIRRSTFHYKQNLVKNIDMNKAESEMKKPH